MAEAIHQLVYVSSASRLMSEYDLLALLNEARSNNEQLGITGMLVYCNGTFIQVLEGEEAVVERLFQKIESDLRHRRCFLLMRQRQQSRAFEGWSMGFRAMNPSELEEVAGYIDFFGERLVPERGPAVYTLLESFRRQNDTEGRLTA